MSCTTLIFLFFFFFNDPATTEIYTLSLHDALPICRRAPGGTPEHDPHRLGAAQVRDLLPALAVLEDRRRSEEHTSELQSRRDLVCRLLLEKKKKLKYYILIL